MGPLEVLEEARREEGRVLGSWGVGSFVTVESRCAVDRRWGDLPQRVLVMTRCTGRERDSREWEVG